ncbi:hypothetical protein MARPO_0014s0130 [Marchantia polymorpha]|uniref:Uncharacterized protein n=1 Tax=Marchantia polymorpha TaxID=3197 RepID=A0A2R6XHQ0_MARPO|nr:hypothetical protein MARPO_0014s0130 [Marchantia polymorpha]|eukprot:PTQ45609.1 hypothetical protein MARPO_0014s0130 [Marchantia polymorpha]
MEGRGRGDTRAAVRCAGAWRSDGCSTKWLIERGGRSTETAGDDADLSRHHLLCSLSSRHLCSFMGLLVVQGERVRPSSSSSSSSSSRRSGQSSSSRTDSRIRHSRAQQRRKNGVQSSELRAQRPNEPKSILEVTGEGAVRSESTDLAFSFRDDRELGRRGGWWRAPDLASCRVLRGGLVVGARERGGRGLLVSLRRGRTGGGGGGGCGGGAGSSCHLGAPGAWRRGEAYLLRTAVGVGRFLLFLVPMWRIGE